MDFSQIYEDLWILVIIDDHSRFIVGQKLMGTPNIDDALDLLNDCIGKYGPPKQILTDHGTQFYAVRGGIATFDIFCIDVVMKKKVAFIPFLRYVWHRGKIGDMEMGEIRFHDISRRITHR